MPKKMMGSEGRQMDMSISTQRFRREMATVFVGYIVKLRHMLSA
jgi:hypothetical protein